jgi:hypothetical protein
MKNLNGCLAAWRKRQQCVAAMKAEKWHHHQP